MKPNKRSRVAQYMKAGDSVTITARTTTKLLMKLFGLADIKVTKRSHRHRSR